MSRQQVFRHILVLWHCSGNHCFCFSHVETFGCRRWNITPGLRGPLEHHVSGAAGHQVCRERGKGAEKLSRKGIGVRWE